MLRRAKLLGRDLSDAELETIRVYIESLGAIDVDDAVRELIAQQWPHLLAKLPLRTRPRRTLRKPPRAWRARVRRTIG
jgi:hypothetical protein